MRRIGLSVVAAAVVVGLVAGCSGGEGSGGAGRSEAAAESSPAGAGVDDGKAERKLVAKRDVEITASGVRDHDVWGPGAYVVEYRITNGGKEAADYFVPLEFLDADGDVLGTTGVTADKLGPGKAHEGDTAPVEAEIRNGKMSDIRSVRVVGDEIMRTPVE